MTTNTVGPDRAVLRILDANLNRLREGVRVVEDIFRYAYDDRTTSPLLKQIRHKARTVYHDACLESRDAENDVLRPTLAIEKSRESLQGILTANFKRAQESARVLEETLKLYRQEEAETFKQIRYQLYTIEKSLLSLDA